MLEVFEGAQQKYDEVRAFAEQVGALDKFEEALERLRNLAGKDSKCTLYSDFAPHSFEFVITRNGQRWINGGLIYSGPGQASNGGGPSFTVSLDPDASQGISHKWSIHT